MVLKSVFRYAVKNRIINDNPAKSEYLTLPKPVKAKIDIFTKQETQKIMECLKRESLDFRLSVTLAVITGCRCGEIGGLKYSDFDFDNCTVTISRSAYKIAGKPVSVKAPKDNESRTVAITPECLHLLRMLKIMNHAKNDDFVFTNQSGIIDPQSISKKFSRFLKKHDIPHRKFHALRHTSATLMLYGGVNVNQVKNRLGHSSLKTTQLYIHCIPEADKHAVGVLQSLIFKKNSGVDADEPTEKTA